MKKLSIKAKVTLWYTSLIVVLLLVGVVYLFSFSGQVFTRQLKYKLIDTVSDTVQEVRFDRNELETEDMDFYKDGISLFLYDTKGYLLAPRINRGMQVDAILEDQAVKQVEMGDEVWLVHDLYAEKEGKGFWIRGILSTSEVKGTIESMMILAVCAIPLFIAIAVFGGWQITKRAFAVIGDMAKTAEHITSGEDLTLRLPKDASGDEVSRLSDTINTMLERLQHSFERERQFTSDASHELRTPVAVILSQCEYGLETEDTAEKNSCLASILRQGKRMSVLLGQLLLLARADSGRIPLQRERIDLGELCQMVTEELEEKAKGAEVSLVCHARENQFVVGDETLCIRLLTNLISNAIDYNVPKGEVSISLEEGAAGDTLTIRDTGKGMSSQELEKIWDRFYRGDSSRNSQGTGLGLSMVKWICKVHQWEIVVESQVGKGSCFQIKIPKEQQK